MITEKGERSPQPTDIFNRHYEGGLGHPQEGKYVVSAASLDAEGNPTGGGFVASFDDLELAKKCMADIRAINPNHKPRVIPAEHLE
jgi:hypothetical protein